MLEILLLFVLHLQAVFQILDLAAIFQKGWTFYYFYFFYYCELLLFLVVFCTL